MRITTLLSTVACASALSLASGALAQETHTLTPHFPDAFTARTTAVTDTDQTTQGIKQSTHTRLVALSDTHRAGDGYKATMAIESMDSSITGPDGKPAAQPAAKADMMSALTSLGKIEVTLDKDMTPVTVDNIEDLKAKLKTRMTGGDDQSSKAGAVVYDMLFASLTPQSAAAFLKQARQANMVYNRPLPLHSPVAIGGTPLNFMGASFRMDGTVTLDSWSEGQTAHLTYVITPDDADMQAFVSNLLKNMVSRLAPGGDDAMAKTMIGRLADNMQMHITMSCGMDVDLKTYVDNHVDCTSETSMTMDLRKIVTEAELKAKPELAGRLQVITMVQHTHTVSDTVIVP